MNGINKILRAALFAAAAAALAFAAEQLREKHQDVSATVDDIEGQIMALDPVTRAGVLTRLGVDSAKAVHDKVH